MAVLNSRCQTLTLILIICTSALHLFFLTREDDLDFKHALQRGAGSAVAFCLSILVIWPVAALLVYLMRVSIFITIPFVSKRASLPIFGQQMTELIQSVTSVTDLTPTQLLLLNITTIEQVCVQFAAAVTLGCQSQMVEG